MPTVALTLSRCLSLKNRLVGRFNRNTASIQSYNSQTVIPSKKDGEEGTVEVDVAALFDQRTKLRNAILSLKVQVSKRNEAIQGKLYLLAELKGEIKFLELLKTDHGPSHFPAGRESRAFKRKPQIEEEIKGFEGKIDVIQEEINSFNASVKIEVGEDVLDLAK